MRTALVINMIIVTVLFLIYLFIYINECKNLMDIHLVSDIFTLSIVPLIIFTTNIFFYVRYKHYIFLLFMSIILFPTINIFLEKRNIDKNISLANNFSKLIVETVLKKLPMVDKDSINMIYSFENNYVKIIIKNSDIEFDYYIKKNIEDEIKKLTSLNVDLFIKKID